jgi:hypothetical protein
VPGSLVGGSCIEVGLGSLAIVPRQRLLYHRIWLVPSSKSPTMVAVPTSFFGGLGRRLVVLFLIAFGMELLGVPMVGLFDCVGE